MERPLCSQPNTRVYPHRNPRFPCSSSGKTNPKAASAEPEPQGTCSSATLLRSPTALAANQELPIAARAQTHISRCKSLARLPSPPRTAPSGCKSLAPRHTANILAALTLRGESFDVYCNSSCAGCVPVIIVRCLYSQRPPERGAGTGEQGAGPCRQRHRAETVSSTVRTRVPRGGRQGAATRGTFSFVPILLPSPTACLGSLPARRASVPRRCNSAGMLSTFTEGKHLVQRGWGLFGLAGKA